MCCPGSLRSPEAALTFTDESHGALRCADESFRVSSELRRGADVH